MTRIGSPLPSWGLLAAALLVGCRADPEWRAWHGALKVTSMMRAEGSCDAEAVPDEPPEPWLFVAVSRAGFDDVATLYWCPEAKDCGVPFDTALLQQLTERRLRAEAAVAEHSAGLCSTRWNDVDAHRDESGRVSLTYRAGSSTNTAMDAEECLDFASDLLGDACDLVLHIEGVR